MTIRQVPWTWLLLGVVAICAAACGGGGGGSGSPTGSGGGGGGPPANGAPRVDAGADRAVDEFTTLTLTGLGSDSEGGPLTYSWSQMSGPPVEFAAPDAATTDVTVPRVDVGTAPTIVLRLEVTDDQGATATDDVSIVVSSTDYLVFIADKEIDEVYELFLYDPEARGTQKLNGPLAAGGDVADFAISPDGTTVAYRADQDIDEQVGLYVARVGGGATRVSAPMIPDGNVLTYRWSPDGTELVYTADAEILGIPEVYLVAPDGSNHRKINGSTANGSVFLDDVRWSPDGRYVSQRVVDKATDRVLGINTHDTQAGGFNSVRVNPPITAARGLFDYAWSPDGDRIAYIADADTEDLHELYVVNPDGTGNTKVSSQTPLGVSAAQWSPDGSMLAYAVYFELFTATPDGSTRTRVADGIIRNFQWSPDGTSLAYVAYDDIESVDELYTLNPDGSAPGKINGPLSATSSGVNDYAWSPSGARLAFRIYDFSGSGFQELYAATADGANLARVNADLVAGGTVAMYQWTPDGAALIYIADQETDGVLEVYSADADGANPRKLNGEVPLASGPSRPDIVLYSADHSRLAVRSGPISGPVTINMMAPDGTGSSDASGPMVSGGGISSRPFPMRWSP